MKRQPLLETTLIEFINWSRVFIIESLELWKRFMTDTKIVLCSIHFESHVSVPHTINASSRFTDTGCAVPSSWAKMETRYSSNIQRKVSCWEAGT